MKNNYKGLKMNLPLLAEDTGAGNGGENNPPDENKPEGKTYTEEELQNLIQSESDKRVTQALKKKESEWEEDYKKRLETEKSEAAKLAEMNAQQKAEYERDQLKAKLDKLEKAETLNQMSKTARGILKDQDISIDDDLLGLLVTTDAEETKLNVNNFAKMFKKAVDDAVNDRVRGKTPKKFTGKGITKEDILKIEDKKERRKMIAENLDLFE